MKITLENLRNLIKEVITETYLGQSMHGGLASTAFNTVGSNIAIENPAQIPVDPVDLAEQIRELIGHKAGYPIGEWGDEALNSAAKAAADALINTNQKDKLSRSINLYEQKQLINEGRNILKELESDSVDSIKLSSSLNKIIDILDSVDMTLDLIYGAVSGHEGPISAIRGLQKSYGRAMGSLSAKGNPEE